MVTADRDKAREMAEPRYSFEIIQGGIVVAEGSGNDLEAIRREAHHYALMYGQDGPLLMRVADIRFFPAIRTDGQADKGGGR